MTERQKIEISKEFKTVTQDNLVFSLDEEEKIAEIVKFIESDNPSKEILIPRSIKYEMQEYIIKSIKNAFCTSEIIHIQIASDSEIEKIGQRSLSSNLMTITIPSSVTELEEGWCKNAHELINVKISPENKNYKNYDNKYVIGKSDSKSDTFDVLIFANRNLKTIEIPKFIKKIAPFSLSSPLLQKVIISPHVTEICHHAFYGCHLLEKVEFDSNSELEIIGEESFSFCPIKNLTIPPKLTELKNGWLDGMRKLEKLTIMQNNERYKNYDDKFVIGKSDPKSDTFDVLIFANRTINGKVTIPSFIKILAPYSFYFVKMNTIVIPSQLREIQRYSFYCTILLNKIEIPENSELQIIEENAFEYSAIQRIFIPTHVKKICTDTFYHCEQLKSIEFSQNSELQTIEKHSFANSKIENISIPSNLVELEEGWNENASNIIKVTVMPNNKCFQYYNDQFVIGKSDQKSDIFDVLVFANKNLIFAEIPPFIKKIAQNAFNYSSIEKVVISPQLVEIANFAFHLCTKLKVFEIPENSQLQALNHNPFYGSSLYSFYIPPHVNKIDLCAFNSCYHIRIIEIDENIDFKLTYKRSLYHCEKAIFMIPAKLRNFF